MQVQFNPEIHAVARPNGSDSRPPSASGGASEASFEQSQALDQVLSGIPDVRPEMVERGKALAGLEQYPPIEMMQKIARLLAIKADDTQPPAS